MAKNASNQGASSSGLEGAWHGQSASDIGTSPATLSPLPHVIPELLSDIEAATLLGMSVRKFHKLRHEEWMPEAVELSPRSLRWVRSELLKAAMNCAPRRKLQDEPAQLRSSRSRKVNTA